MSTLNSSLKDSPDEAVPLFLSDRHGGDEKAIAASLQVLRDEESSYPVICKACVSLTGLKWKVIDSSFSDKLQEIFQALATCFQEHNDRRARILGLKTLAIVARSNYARLTVSPLIYSYRDTASLRVQDEILSEIPSKILKAAIEDTDDGVSAYAFQALGLLVTSNSATVSPDNLFREIHSIAFGGTSFAPSLRSVADEDPAVLQTELSTRVLDNILGPRLLQILERALLYSDTRHWTLCLPILVDTLLYQRSRSVAEIAALDRASYTKRWADVDVEGWIQHLTTHVLEPALISPDPTWAYAASLGILRLSPNETVIERATICLLSQYSAKECLEDRITLLATVLIGQRAKPSYGILSKVMNRIISLPPTTLSPLGVSSPGLLIDGFRKPARTGLWAELALCILLDAPQGQRSTLLQQILSDTAVGVLLSSDPDSVILSTRDELVYSFCTVATYAGRRSRLAEPAFASETFKCQRLLLSYLLPIIKVTPTQNHFLDEDLSLLVQAQVSYTRLLQEFLHETGTLRHDVSVAVKLAANALPPHLFWDSLSDSSHALQQFEATVFETEASTKIMHEIVSADLDVGIPSPHMRLFLLSIAADHWCRCRAIDIMKVQEGKKGSTPDFSTDYANKIILAINPKRIVSKVLRAQKSVSKDDNRKRKDPIKKLALETARVCAACIETIALIACDWRHRFGSGQDTKHIISLSVGALQGKVDDTPYDDTLRGILRGVCESAVARVQAFYESGSETGNDQVLPISDLVTGQVKMKIKPLVSSSSPQARTKDDFLLGYLTELSRQFLIGRIDLAFQNMIPVDSSMTKSRSVGLLRLERPPVSLVRDGQRYGLRANSLEVWNRQVKSSYAGSDPIASLVALTHRKVIRCDGDEEYSLFAIIRVHNLTAVPIEDGLRLDIGVVGNGVHAKENEDPTTLAVIEALGGSLEDTIRNFSPFSSSVVVRKTIDSGDFVLWEVQLEDLSPGLHLSLLPSITFRNIKKEPEYRTTQICNVSGDGDHSTVTGVESLGGEGDFHVNHEGLDGESMDIENVTLVGDPLPFSPMLLLQPCPMVFYRDAVGDIESFRFLWFRMVHYLPPLSLEALPVGSAIDPDPVASRIVEMSGLAWEGEAIPNGYASKLWCFMSLKGTRILCLLAEREDEDKPSSAPFRSLHIRGDDKPLLYSLLGTRLLRERFVKTLTPELNLVG